MSNPNENAPNIKKSNPQNKLKILLWLLLGLITGGALSSVEPSKFYLTFIKSPTELLSIATAMVTLIIGYFYGSRGEESSLNEAESSTHVDSSRIMGTNPFHDQSTAIEGGGTPPFNASAELSTKSHLHTPFEIYANAVVEAIDKRIGLSEMKANGLLVKGQRMMGIGVAVYLFFIIFWQFLNHSWGYNEMILVGFISSSMLFIVLEFLAAWYLKQYRSFVDLSAAYLQIRCIYNNYLLTYYSLNQFSSETDIRDSLAEMLARKIDWPSFNDMNKNDFNYMLSSIEGFSGVLDRLKTQLNPSTKDNEEKN